MCFDAQSSYIAWGISASSAWYLYKRNRGYDRWNASFIACFSSIQLFEMILWSNDPRKSSSLNKLMTKIIAMALMAQPIIQSFGAYSYTRESFWWFLGWLLVAAFIALFFRVFFAPADRYRTVIGEKGHLIWEDTQNPSKGVISPYGPLYLAGIFLPLIAMGIKGLPLIAVGMLSAFYSFMVAGPGEFGSYWCYTAVAYSVAAILSE